MFVHFVYCNCLQLCYNIIRNKQKTQSVKTIKSERECTMSKEKTSFESITRACETMSQYFTVQDNEINQYARVCYTDNFKKDNYKIFKDFAIYYDRVNSYKISIADSTLVDCKVFKETHNKTEKTRALEFSVSTDNLINTLFEITAQRLLQSDKALELTFNIKSTATKKKQSKKQTA